MLFRVAIRLKHGRFPKGVPLSLEERIKHQVASLPRKSFFPAQLIGEADHHYSVFNVLRQERRSWSKALRQQQYLVPSSPGWFIVVHSHRRIAMARPGDEFRIGLTAMLGDWNVRNLFDMKNTFG